MIHEDYHQGGDSFAPFGMTREANEMTREANGMTRGANGMTGGTNEMTTEAVENADHDMCHCHSEEAGGRRKNLSDHHEHAHCDSHDEHDHAHEHAHCNCHHDHGHAHEHAHCNCHDDHDHTHENAHCNCHDDHDHAHEGHHHHHHHEEEGETKETLIKIAAATVLLIAAVIIEKRTDWPTWAYLLIYLIPYLIVGWETIKEAVEALARGEALDENFLMTVATLGALVIGFLPGAQTQFPEAVFVMLFFQVGELFEGIAEGRSRKSISHLMDIRPDTAHVERQGKLETVAPETVKKGEVIVIQPGEKVPMDGIVLDGDSSLDTVALTGESVPRAVHPEDEILSGCVNLTGVLRVRTTKAFGESTAAKILDLVENAAEHKSKSESFITKFAKVYTPIVVGLAVALALIPSLITGEWATWIYRALMFLVVSCPCALVISIPLTFFGGIGGATRKGILVKGANFMDTLSRVKTVVFDKTGTLTEGVFEVTAVHPELIDEKELLHLAAHVERHSTHPIAAALRLAYPDEQDDCSVTDIRETAGHGVTATVNGKRVAVGNEKHMAREGAKSHPCELKGTVIHVSIDGVYAGHVVISDRVKADAAEAVAALHRAGVRRTVMLTGDEADIAAAVASAVGVDTYHAGLLPADKVAHVEALLNEGRPSGPGEPITSTM